MDKAIIQLKSKQTLDGQTEETVHTYQAKATKKQESWYFAFKENSEEDVSTVLKVNAQEITLLRQGSVQMKQVFHKGQSHTTRYVTPYLAYIMEIHTNKLKIQENGNGPTQIQIGYQLWLNEQYAGEIQLQYDIAYQ